MVYKPFSSWGPKNVSTMSTISGIVILKDILSPQQRTIHTHTHTHTFDYFIWNDQYWLKQHSIQIFTKSLSCLI